VILIHKFVNDCSDALAIDSETAADADTSRTHEKPTRRPERRWRCLNGAGITWRAPAAWHVRLGGASRSPGPTGAKSQPCTTIHERVPVGVGGHLREHRYRVLALPECGTTSTFKLTFNLNAMGD